MDVRHERRVQRLGNACQPVVAHGVLYATSPKLRVFALNAATGAVIWSFETNQDAKTLTRTRIRGLMYWERGEDRRIYFASRHWLYALDAVRSNSVCISVPSALATNSYPWM